MAHLVVIRGLPGTGKTTLAKEYAAQGYRHFEYDYWHYNPVLDSWMIDRDKSKARWHDAKAKVQAALDNEENVVISGIFQLDGHIAPIRRYADIYGHSVTVRNLLGHKGDARKIKPSDLKEIKSWAVPYQYRTAQMKKKKKKKKRPIKYDYLTDEEATIRQLRLYESRLVARMLHTTSYSVDKRPSPLFPWDRCGSSQQ